MIEKPTRRFSKSRTDRALVFLAAAIVLQMLLPAVGLWPYGAAVEGLAILAGAFVLVLGCYQGVGALDLRSLAKLAAAKLTGGPGAKDPA